MIRITQHNKGIRRIKSYTTAVSIQLKNFQYQFPIPRTEVVGRKLCITDFGQEIAGAAYKILKEVNAINYKTIVFQGKLSGKLKIASASTKKYVMPYFFSQFLPDNPEVELVIDVTNKSKVVSSLEKNEIGFVLVSVVPEKLQLRKVPLMPNSLYLVGNKEFQFSKKYGYRLKKTISSCTGLFRVSE